MANPRDKYNPRINLQFPDGGVLCLGTTTCDDQIHQAVYLSYTSSGSTTPKLELELPPKSVEVLLRYLQQRANEARFVNGERMLVYPEPYPVNPSRPERKAPRRQPGKKKTEPKQNE